MNENCNWLFQDSPALLLVLDESLVCRDLTAAWRDRIALPQSESVAIPAAELFDLENNSALLDQFSGVVRDCSAIVDAVVGLLTTDGTVH